MKKNINTQAQLDRNDRTCFAYLLKSMQTPEENFEEMEMEILREHQANEDFRLAS